MPEFFGRYELLELLGRGGMGEVYRAYDTERQREVALKLLPENLVSDAQFTARFRRESLLAAQLSEPHIVPIHDFGEIDGRLFIDMRIVEGADLGSVLSQRGPLVPRVAVDVVRQIAAALDAAHQRALVHRDVKPSNIMLTALSDDPEQAPFAYLVDFGIARGSDQMTSLTTDASSTVGTIAYMAPERVSGEAFDHRSDVYALACVLYEALTASMPFTGDAVALMFAHLTRDAPRPSERVPGLPPAMDEVVRRGMAKDPGQRYSTAGELGAAAAAALAAPVTGPVPAPVHNPGATTTSPHYYSSPAPPTQASYGAQFGPPTTFGAAAHPPTTPPRRGWTTTRKAVVAGAAVLVAAVAVGVPLALSGGDGSGGAGPSASAGAGGAAKGGTLTYLVSDTVTTWDPQRIARSRDQSIATRLFTRTLLQLGPGTGTAGPKLTPDLATDLGHVSADGKTWTFTLKSGVRWQDGSTLTCGDVAYGISRSFDLKINTAFSLLPPELIDVRSYLGPFDGDNQAAYDKAVACSGQTLTVHLNRPLYDFDYAVTLPVFAPVKKAQDHRDQQPFAIFSDGPYRLSKPWDSGTGATFVRNEQYDPSTDDPTVRRALPDTIVLKESVGNDEIDQQLFTDTGAGATTVSGDEVSPSAVKRAAALSERFTSAPASLVNFVVPNFSRLKDLRVRQALVYGLDRVGYIDARGGTTAATPVYGVVPPWVGPNGGYSSFRAFDVNSTGNASRAKSLLDEAGVKTPLALRFVIRSESPTNLQEGAKALVTGWNNAGFKVTLEALPDSSYGPLVEDPANAAKWDLTILAWSPEYFTASTIIPSLFDSRTNLTAGGNGADLGRYSDTSTNSAIDTARQTADASARNDQWSALDLTLAQQVAYIPLDNPHFARLHGSKVTNYAESTATFGFPDLGQIGVRA